MRSRVLPALGLSVVALAVASSLAPMASAASGPSAATNNAGSAGLERSAAVCGGNTGTPDGNGLTSQNFEAAFDAYDANGAADFKTKKCVVTTVDIVGSFSVAGPAQSATVTIHKKNPNKPAKCTSTGGGAGPNFSVTFSGCTLKKGKYWVTAQANMDFQPNGQWYWSTTAIQEAEDMWRNPGGGFGVGCTTYGTNGACLGFASDYLFTVNKA